MKISSPPKASSNLLQTLSICVTLENLSLKFCDTVQHERIKLKKNDVKNSRCNVCSF